LDNDVHERLQKQGLDGRADRSLRPEGSGNGQTR